MMCLASCQVFGEILGKTIKETKHHQGRALHPICMQFVSSKHTQPFLQIRPPLAYSAVMQPASWRVRSGSETNFKAPPSWNSRQPMIHCCFGGPWVWDSVGETPRKWLGTRDSWKSKYPEIRIPNHQFTMSWLWRNHRRSKKEFVRTLPQTSVRETQKNYHLAAAEGWVEKKNMSVTQNCWGIWPDLLGWFGCFRK